MRVLKIGSDRSKHGAIVQGTPAFLRQEAYAKAIGHIDDISFTLKLDNFSEFKSEYRSVYLTKSKTKLLYGLDAIKIARTLEKPNIVSVQDPFEAGLIAWIISVMLKVPMHVQVHTDFLNHVFSSHSILNKIRTYIAGFVLCRAGRIRVVSSSIKDSIVARYHPKAEISVLPIFVDTSKFLKVRHQQHPLFERSLLFVGRLELEKRPFIAISALARVRELGINAGLTIVGDGSLRNRLKEFAKKKSVENYVDLVGHVDPLPHYAHADILLVPSAYEGYGLVIVEALTAGVPVLSTDVGVAREAGAIIAPHDADGFSGALCSLFAHEYLPKGRLKEYPYKDEYVYVEAWANDMRATQLKGRHNA